MRLLIALSSAYNYSQIDMKEEYVKTQVLEKGQVVQVWPTDTSHRTFKKNLLINYRNGGEECGQDPGSETCIQVLAYEPPWLN